jgi:O-antigen ligase
MWRLMFWSYEFNINFINNPIFGIGFGTKLFDASSQITNFIVSASPNDTNLEYTLGMHNSFLQILIRLGLAGFLPILSIYFIIFYRIKKYNLYEDNIVISLFLSFVFISVSALFNVVMESSLYSGSYWIILGMLYQSIQQYKYKEGIT